MAKDTALTGLHAIQEAQAAAQVFDHGYVEVHPVEGANDAPADIRHFLAKLRLLHQVPFSYLVPDADLLPLESIRFFYLDRNWTDAMVQGVLSVGTITTTDRAQLETAYPVLRDEVDQTERDIRPGSEAGRLSDASGTVTGFLLRSRAVSGWPNLHVRGYSVDSLPDNELTDIAEDSEFRMKVLRMERLAPSVLLVLFDGVPEVIHIEEPRQGIQFGFRPKQGTTVGSEPVELPLRAVATGAETGDTVSVPFRPDAPGVVDITNLRRRIEADLDTGSDDRLGPNEMALQLLRFPYRQVFGDPDNQAERFYDMDRFQVSLGFAQWEAHLSALVRFEEE